MEWQPQTFQPDDQPWMPTTFQPDAPVAAVPQSSTGEQLFRQLGLAGRDLAGAVPMGIASIGDLANTGINAATGAINKYAGTSIPQLGMPTDAVQKGLNATGLFPQPQNAVERGVGDAASALFSGGESTVPAAKQMASNAMNLFARPAGPQTSAAAKAVASQFYQQAADTGGILKPSFTNNFIDQASTLAPQTPAGKLFAGETPITQMVGRLQSLKDQPLALPEVQEIDEHLGNMIDNEYGTTGLSKDGKNLLGLQSNLRNMVKDASPDDVVGGTGGFDALNSGRSAWAQAMKMQDIERIQTRAQYSENPSQTIKTGVRTLLSNPSRTRGYSPDELSALQDAGQRGVIGGTLNVLGSKLIPIGAGLVGESAGGPAGAAVNFAISHAGTSLARKGASALQNARLQNVLNTMGSKVGPAVPQTFSGNQVVPFSLMPLLPSTAALQDRGEGQ